MPETLRNARWAEAARSRSAISLSTGSPASSQVRASSAQYPVGHLRAAITISRAGGPSLDNWSIGRSRWITSSDGFINGSVHVMHGQANGDWRLEHAKADRLPGVPQPLSYWRRVRQGDEEFVAALTDIPSLDIETTRPRPRTADRVRRHPQEPPARYGGTSRYLHAAILVRHRIDNSRGLPLQAFARVRDLLPAPEQIARRISCPSLRQAVLRGTAIETVDVQCQLRSRRRSLR